MNTQLSRDDIKDLRNSLECWQQYYDPKDDAKQYEMFGSAIVAADMLLAAMESEPVYQLWSAGIHEWIECDKKGFDNHKYFPAQRRVLYTAPTAPVLPDGLRLALSNAGIAAPESDEMLAATSEKYVQLLVDWVKDRRPFTPAPVAVPDGVSWEDVPEEITCHDIDIASAWAKGFNQCRAAMLKAEPVTCWIKCSDRMPENKPGCFEYIVFDSLNNRAHHDYWNVPEPGDDAFTPFWNHYGQYVTHWMPLPAAPEQEV